MIKLTINNSMSSIEGLSAEQFRELRDLMSYRVESQQAYFSGSWKNSVRHLLGRRGDFPTGLLYIAQDWAKSGSLEINTLDQRIRPKMTYKALLGASLRVPPYPEQENAVKAILERYRGIISAPTGVGKSLIITMAIRALGVKTLVVVPSLELRRQLRESLSETFGSENVGGLGSLIAVENVAALDPKTPLKDYDCVIIDEFHHSAAKTYRQLNQKAWDGVYHRIGMTATPFRSKDEEQLLLESILSQVIYRIDYQHAVNQGYIVPLEAYYVELPKREVEGNPTNWASVYSELVVNNDYRNFIIQDMLLTLHRGGKSTLCLVKEIAHGETLSCDGAFRFANGQDGEAGSLIQDFNNCKPPVLIGTTGVLGEGIDSRPCEYVIIAGLGKSKPQFMQAVGRGLRKYPGKESAKVILFYDPSHKWTKEHWKAQCRYLREEYGVEPAKLD